MLGDRHELDVREIEAADIGRKLVRKLAIGEPAAALLGPSPPGAEMRFIDGDRRVQGIASRRCRRSRPYRLHVGDNRRRLRPKLRRECDRVGLERQQFAQWADDLEFVLVAGTDSREEDFPEAVAAHAHGVTASVPGIEVADHADAFGIGRQHGKGDARDAIVLDRMRPQFVIELKVAAFAQEMQIDVGQDRQKPVRIVELNDRFAKTHAQAIGHRVLRTPRREQSGGVYPVERRFPAVVPDCRNLQRIGHEHAQDGAALVDMRTEVVERIGVAAFDHRDGFRRERLHGEALTARATSWRRIRLKRLSVRRKICEPGTTRNKRSDA